jgi:predicted negative regulator of RcsB-dependent stress response
VSPKNKGKFGKSKVSAVPVADEFISGIDRVLRALKPHAMRLGIFFGVIAVIVIGYTTWSWWKGRKLTSASEIYARAVALSEVPVEAPPPPGPDGKAPPAAPEEDDPNTPPDPRGLPKKFASAEERARAVLAELEELAADYGSTGVGRQGILLQAESLYQLGRYADAAERYREYADGGGPEDLVLSAREGLAYSLEGQAMAEKDAKARQDGLEKTLKAFADMQPQSDGPRRDESLYHQARIQAELGRRDEARQTLEQILANHPDSNLKDDIEMRLPALRAAAPAK